MRRPVLAAVVPALAWISAKFQSRILKSARVVRKTNSRLTASYNESIQGVRTAKVFAREAHDLEEFRELSGEMYAASVRNALQSALYLPVVLTIASLATGAALAAGGFEVTAGRISIGTLIAFLLEQVPKPFDRQCALLDAAPRPRREAGQRAIERLPCGLDPPAPGGAVRRPRDGTCDAIELVLK